MVIMAAVAMVDQVAVLGGYGCSTCGTFGCGGLGVARTDLFSFSLIF